MPSQDYDPSYFFPDSLLNDAESHVFKAAEPRSYTAEGEMNSLIENKASPFFNWSENRRDIDHQWVGVRE